MTKSAYASVSRFRIDDLKPYIYRTHDSGKTWQLITTGLPDNAPVDTVREDPVRKGLLFAGTETSVWVSFDDGDHWQSLQLNLPHTSMRDLWIYEDDLILATHGRSFWILDDISPLRQIKADTADTSNLLFKPAPAYRVRRSTYTDTPMPPDEPAGENPPNGAIIDYYLSRRFYWRGHARNFRLARETGSQVFEHGQTRPNGRRNRQAADSSLLDSAAEDSLRAMRECTDGSGICIIPRRSRCAMNTQYPLFRTIRPGIHWVRGHSPASTL